MSGAVILVADDDRSIRTVLTQALGRLGHDVRATANAATLWGWIAAGEGDLVITDVVMPDENGLDLLPRIKRQRPELPVIVMSARNTLRTAVTAAERGAYEYLPKPFDLNELVAAAQSALAQPLARDLGPPPPSAPDEPMPLIGRAPAMQDIYRAIARLTGTDLTVMITGESGTGKELVARALHEFGRRRRHGPFVAINMAAIPRELIESEMFGHEKGAFTGANARHVGRFEQAESGTLFLDEIGDMPLDAQTRLLRVLQSGEYTRVGGTTAYKADVRIIAATHRDLRQLVRQGQFREDLFYRLNVVPLRLPPLRERIEDLPELAQHFLSQAAAEGLPQKVLDGQAIEVLKQYSWPGNVRELENLMRRLAALNPDEVIAAAAVRREIADATAPGARAAFEQGEGIGAAVEQHLDTYFAAHRGGLPPNGLYLRLLREVERPLIALSLRATRGNQLRAAELLGINRNTLRKKIRELDIPVVRGTR